MKWSRRIVYAHNYLKLIRTPGAVATEVEPFIVSIRQDSIEIIIHKLFADRLHRISCLHIFRY